MDLAHAFVRKGQSQELKRQKQILFSNSRQQGKEQSPTVICAEGMMGVEGLAGWAESSGGGGSSKVREVKNR